MRHPFGGNRIHEGLNNVRLPDHIIKSAGSIFSRGDLVVHVASFVTREAYLVYSPNASRMTLHEIQHQKSGAR